MAMDHKIFKYKKTVKLLFKNQSGVL